MGSQTPSEVARPKYSESDGPDAVKILNVAGLYVDEWQEDCLDSWMGLDGDEWTAPTCGLSVPRQNGKTCIVSGRAVAGMILYGEWVLYTAHLQKTATETFLEIRSLLETPGLSKYVKEIKSAIGREQIILKNGGRMMFVARTRNGGRGMHGDVLLFDEAQELTSEQQASFLPALSASKNPQTIYLGTPPDASADGTVFRGLRKKALSGKSNGISWTEFSVPDIGNVTDRERWAQANPALGIRIKESTVASECDQMDPDTFARERLGWWSPEVTVTIDYALDHKKWSECMSDQSKPEGKTAYGVKFSVDGSEVCLSGACAGPDGKVRISVIQRKSTAHGIRWLGDWLNERYQAASCVVIDGRNGADLLVDRIADKWKVKGSIVRPSAKDIISAASYIVDAVNENNLTWYKFQDDLNNSATTSIKRSISGGYGFGGDNSLPIEACALAMFGVKTSRRDPNKKMRVG